MKTNDLAEVIWPPAPELVGAAPEDEATVEALRRWVRVHLISIKIVAEYHDLPRPHVLDPRTGEWKPL